MKLLKKLFSALIILSAIAMVAGYFLLQSSIGARWASEWLKNQYGYPINIERIGYSVLSPFALTLNNVTLSDDTLSFEGQKIVLDIRWPTQAHSSAIKMLTLEEGTLTIQAQNKINLPVASEQWNVKNVAVRFKTPVGTVEGKGLYGGIQFSATSSTLQPLSDAQFRISAQQISTQLGTLHNLILQGSVQNGRWKLDTLGADIAQGALTAQAEQQADRSWQIDSLQMSHIRWQSDRSLRQLWQPFIQLPPLTIKRLDLLDTQLEGVNWAFRDVDFTLKNMRLTAGEWSAEEEGSFDFSAITAIFGRYQLTDPMLKLAVTPDQVAIKQFTTRYDGGIVRAVGTWLRTEKKVSLDEVAVAALETSLPSRWRQILQTPLPTGIQEIEIKKLTANRNLIIDTSVDFPFQMTQLEGQGRDLLLAHQGEMGFWRGQLTLNASQATFNKVDLRHPSIKLNADEQALTVNEFSAFTQQGLLEARATLLRQEEHPFQVTLNGRASEFSLLHQWGWGSRALPGSGNFQMNLQGKMQPITPSFRETLQGTLDTSSASGAPLHQVMRRGQIVGQASEEPTVTDTSDRSAIPE